MEIPVLEKKTTSVRCLGKVDISTIKPLILNLSEAVWSAEDKRKMNNSNCLHHTQHIILRAQTSLEHSKSYVERPHWKFWEAKLMPVIQQAVAPYEYEKGTVPKALFAKLLHGYDIDAHIDTPPRNRQIHKIHVPIQTNPDVTFSVGGASFHMKVGYAYEVNNIASHSVSNKGDIDRVHFIFEYCPEI
ncbi:MAG: aspartyl/asparaginyl beta-hydroxylase domain-containing protein [Flammeovirgaceae bacterium]